MPRRLDCNIKGFIESSFLDWPGQVAAVIFLAGCNFRCPFCHNHGLVLEPESFPTIEWEDILSRLTKFRGWIDGVVVSGGEPTLTPDLPDLIRDIRNHGFQVKLDTNGGRPGVLAHLLKEGLIDHVAMDIKASLTEMAYARAIGRTGFLDRVRESLALLKSFEVPYTLRTTVVPGLHTEEDILELAIQLDNAPEWLLQNFNPENALDPDFRKIEPIHPARFEELQEKVRRIREPNLVQSLVIPAESLII